MEVEVPRQTYEQRAAENSRKHRRVAYRLTKKKGAQEQCWLFQLPPEIVEHILHFLTRPDDALRFMASCRRAYNTLRRDARFWGRFYPKLYFTKTPQPYAQHSFVRCELALDAAEQRYPHALWPNDKAERWRRIDWQCVKSAYDRQCGKMRWGREDNTCTDPKHYPRTLRIPKTTVPEDPFDSVCKALSKHNLAEYKKEAQRTTSNRLRDLYVQKQDTARRIEMLKDHWVYQAAEYVREEERQKTFKEKMEKSLPFIDLADYFETSSS